MGSFRLSKRSRKNRRGVDPRLIEISDLAIKITKVDFGIPEYGGIRTPDVQNGLYLSGKSKLDGFNKESYHQTGRALDFYAYTNGQASWRVGDMAMVAAAFLQAASTLGYKLEWGGLWRTFQDMPHVQLTD